MEVLLADIPAASYGCRVLLPFGLDGKALSAEMYSVVGDDKAESMSEVALLCVLVVANALRSATRCALDFFEKMPKSGMRVW